MENILREPVELTEIELDAVAGGFLNGSGNVFSFNGNGSHDGNANGNSLLAVITANGNVDGSGDGNLAIG
jgi:hypothetical protein